MAQRDYVSRGRSNTRRKKTTSRRKSNASGLSKTMIALAVAVLVTFAGGLYFIAHNKPAESPVLPHQNTGKGNGLPPKPEERWRYIKELENRQLGVSTPTEPSAGGGVQSPTQLTDEQRQLLEQMQSDMRRQPTPLSEVPYNDQTQVPRSQVIIKPPEQTQPITPPPPVTRSPAAAAPAAPKQEVAKQPEAAKTQRWMVQCGSFKSMEPAESVRAQLAFAGIESRIASNGGWNRIMLGPYNNRAAADKMLQRLKEAGASSCIPLASGG
ncbi:cell division protein FtsN [Brenneria goodwinii]|nr:cell division protein FtsN [Brenneria goodwinii]MCG8156029.1 cell division protein FtsN [Brenneria goodwinii]MCG8161871.1 cell division protein FtsN [Brenneria goodwinii]MCG8166488.1 cell division protein FtsN [Brenneria goodwinii]MCG8169531.1 cell division protein FtsN [Brenneria goodwinii]MCG8174864.1 cell division protein FtsN [Brenneria goodwinii]